MRHYGSILFALTYLFIGWLVIMHAQHRNHELFLDSRAMLSGKTHFEQRTTCETELISRITIRIALGNVIPDENNWLFRSLSKTQFIYTGLYYVISVRTEGIPPSTNDMIVGDSTMRSTTRQEKSDIFLVMT